jgi:hypothetical protein
MSVPEILKKLGYDGQFLDPEFDKILQLSGFPTTLFRAIFEIQKELKKLVASDVEAVRHDIGSVLIRCAPNQSPLPSSYKPFGEKRKFSKDLGMKNGRLEDGTDFEISRLELEIKKLKNEIIEVPQGFIFDIDELKNDFKNDQNQFDRERFLQSPGLWIKYRCYRLIPKDSHTISEMEAKAKKLGLEARRPHLRNILDKIDFTQNNTYLVIERKGNENKFDKAKTVTDIFHVPTTTDADIYNIAVIPQAFMFSFDAYRAQTAETYDAMFKQGVWVGGPNSTQDTTEKFSITMHELIAFLRKKGIPVIAPKAPGPDGLGIMTPFDRVYIDHANLLQRLFEFQLTAKIAQEVGLPLQPEYKIFDYCGDHICLGQLSMMYAYMQAADKNRFTFSAAEQQKYPELAKAIINNPKLLIDFMKKFDSPAMDSQNQFQHGHEGFRPDEVYPFGTRVLIISDQNAKVTETCGQLVSAIKAFAAFMILNPELFKHDKETKQAAEKIVEMQMDSASPTVRERAQKSLTPLDTKRRSSLSSPIASPQERPRAGSVNELIHRFEASPSQSPCSKLSSPSSFSYENGLANVGIGEGDRRKSLPGDLFAYREIIRRGSLNSSTTHGVKLESIDERVAKGDSEAEKRARSMSAKSQ